ncbi:unnamed protein product [Durusdinium trenchii]|uniref:EamA domain-containing protein n=1 Tax=Durusdinium trenchii TaxID=1381693 RepID=A0ABP0JGZ1_9DINO
MAKGRGRSGLVLLCVALAVCAGTGFVSNPGTPRLTTKAKESVAARHDGPVETVAPPQLDFSTKTAELDSWLSSLPGWLWRAVILFLTMLWATNFAVIKDITAQPGVNTQMYAVSRFTVAAGVLLPWISSISSQKVFLRAAECGSWLAFGYIGQAIGLMTTTASKSCFICTLNVVFVAMIIGITKKKFDPQTLMAATLAVCGVGFLELAGSQQFVIGDLISLAQPVGFGMGYIRLEEIMQDSPKDALPVAAVKLTMVALASWAYFAVTAGTVDLDPVFSSNVAMTGILYTGLVTTALAVLVESVAFRFVDAASASAVCW